MVGSARAYYCAEAGLSVAFVDRGPIAGGTTRGRGHILVSDKDWSIVDRLPAVDVPTLVINGRYDEATDDCVRPYVEQIPGAQHTCFASSSHMPHVEERELYMNTVDAFLEEK